METYSSSELGGEVLGGGDRGECLTAELRGGGRAGCLGQAIDECLRFTLRPCRVDADGFEQRCGDAVGLIEQRDQQMCRTDIRITRRRRRPAVQR